MTMIEKAARAAAEHYGEDWELLPDVNPIPNGDLDRRHFIEMVRAVLHAIREPSEDMACAAVDSYWMAIKGSADDANIIQTHDMGNMYTAMIDAALGEVCDE